MRFTKYIRYIPEEFKAGLVSNRMSPEDFNSFAKRVSSHNDDMIYEQEVELKKHQGEPTFRKTTKFLFPEDLDIETSKLTDFLNKIVEFLRDPQEVMSCLKPLEEELSSTLKKKA